MRGALEDVEYLSKQKLGRSFVSLLVSLNIVNNYCLGITINFLSPMILTKTEKLREKQFKQPCQFEFRKGIRLDMPKTWPNFTYQVENFEEFCFDVLS